MIIYVSDEQLAEQDGEPTLAQTVASALVRNHIRGIYYRTDKSGQPVDPDIRQLLQTAVQTQVEYWANSEIDLTRADIESDAVESKTLGPASVKYGSAAASVERKTTAAGTLAPAVLALLAGLGMPHHPVAW